MNALLIYTSKHGTTEKVAEIIRNSSKHNIQLNNLKINKKPSIENYDMIIIGSSIHAGNIPSKTKKFLAKNNDLLLSKKLALYLVCMNHDDAITQMDNNFPEDLRKHAIINTCVGGEFLFEKMNKLEKILVKKIAGKSESISELKNDNIQNLITEIDKLN